ncbi:MAG: P-loop NTPase [Syntrophales bacterium]|jgi:CO dehydrogenase maturation factor|nr:P-loop NTPase [Syntrophales bacterium]MDY0043300.1 P-loop NTPase [Syntrophales bacterium]
MGTFHCPLGCPFYDGEGCILCGLCVAANKYDMIKASEKIRAYLRSQSDRKSRFKKIAVCGKGGVGKSTMVTLIAKALQDENAGVLVIDTDESNPGLFHNLGFARSPKPLMKLLSRFGSGETESDPEWVNREEITIADIPPDYIVEDEGLKFSMVGKIEDPFQGCACSLADVSRNFIDKLVLAENEIVIIDVEAGIESFGRGIERSVDTVLIVVEPSSESLSVAEKISYMADGIGVAMVKAVLNKIPSEEVRRKMIENLALKNISQAGAVFTDAQVAEASLMGRTIGETKAMEEVRAIVRRLREKIR